MRIFFLPLEPLDMRYTKQWFKMFKEVFEMKGVDYVYIVGDRTYSQLQPGQFYNFRDTFVWKFSQLKKLFEYDLKDDDVIFIPDGEFPGMEAIEYFRKIMDSKVKLVAIWHGGTYDPWDLTYRKGLERIAPKLEEVWFDIVDMVFVSVNFHKNLIVRNRMVDASKIIVTGLPHDIKMLRKFASKEKEFDIIFGGRLSEEKGYGLVKYIFNKLEKEGYRTFITQEHNLPKEEMYKILGRSKLLFAPSNLENFGYVPVEALAMNVPPIVPDALSFKEIVPEEFRYKKGLVSEEVYNFIIEKINNYQYNNKLYKVVEKYQYQEVIGKMVDYIVKLTRRS